MKHLAKPLKVMLHRKAHQHLQRQAKGHVPMKKPSPDCLPGWV
jgi:hypothetical protein